MSVLARFTVSFATVFACWMPGHAQAALCTVSGFVAVQPMDTYYCDSGVPGNQVRDCTGWKEQDLWDPHPVDPQNNPIGITAVRPMSHMVIAFTDLAFNVLDVAVSDDSGFYQAVVDVGAGVPCNGALLWGITYYMRSSTADWQGLGRFALIDQNQFIEAMAVLVPLTGSATDASALWAAAETPDWFARAASLYWTANSAVEEIAAWSSNLSGRFNGFYSYFGNGMPRVLFDPNLSSEFTAYAQNDPWWIYIDYERFSRGGTIRHELGHLVHYATHNRNMSGTCDSYNLNLSSGHVQRGCEYGHEALKEGLATFYGVRSMITGPGTDGQDGAWRCTCGFPFNEFRDICSLEADSSVFVQPDRLDTCFSGTISGLGDDFASDIGHCASLLAAEPGPGGNPQGAGCACLDANDDGFCDYASLVPQPQPCVPDPMATSLCQDKFSIGWRNEYNVARFMWDVMDGNNEAGGDDSTRAIEDIVADFEAMTCLPGSGYNVNGTCNEPNRSDPFMCDPLFPWTLPSGAQDGTRDSYNVVDVANHVLPGNEDDELVLNCVDQAPDTP